MNVKLLPENKVSWTIDGIEHRIGDEFEITDSLYVSAIEAGVKLEKVKLGYSERKAIQAEAKKDVGELPS